MLNHYNYVQQQQQPLQSQTQSHSSSLQLVPLFRAQNSTINSSTNSSSINTTAYLLPASIINASTTTQHLPLHHLNHHLNNYPLNQQQQQQYYLNHLQQQSLQQLPLLNQHNNNNNINNNSINNNNNTINATANLIVHHHYCHENYCGEHFLLTTNNNNQHQQQHHQQQQQIINNHQLQQQQQQLVKQHLITSSSSSSLPSPSSINTTASSTTRTLINKNNDSVKNLNKFINCTNSFVALNLHHKKININFKKHNYKLINNNNNKTVTINTVTTNPVITTTTTTTTPTTSCTPIVNTSVTSSSQYPCNKRGSDELLSQAAVMAPASDNNNQDLATKKAKLDSNTVLGAVGKPSRVIHIRNIPNESSEPEVIQLGLPFGRVTNVLVLKGKNQAFLEMGDEVSAAAMVTCFTSNPPQVRGRTVYVQFSNHRELKTDQSHSITYTHLQSASAALQNQEFQIQSPASGSPLPVSGAETNNTAQGIIQGSQLGIGIGGGIGGPNTVLRVIVESLLYPVSLDILHQIFQRFGKVLKIVTFTKNNSFQALIQYPDAQTAQHAKAVLDGQNIYNGCCTLRIDNSKLTALNVKYNNDKSRDFTNPSLPPGEPGSEVIAGAGGLVNASDLLLLAARQRPTLTGDRIVNGLGGPGVLPPFALGLGTPLTGAYGGTLPSLGAFALASTGALGASTPALRGLSNVLLVSNLNEEMVTPDALFTLFGVYGDVQRVKILYNKKDSALIQMAEHPQAYLAMTHLDKLRLWGKLIRVMASKHQAVQLPKEGQPDAGLTRDYAQNPLHRFKKPGSKNYQNIYPPSATLHLSNIPSTVTEEDIREAFTKNNFEVKAFKFFPSKDRKMALLQLSSVEEAVLALIKMHNYQLSESNHLRVSFSKSNI